MANSLTAASASMWSKLTSRLLQKQTVFRSVASFSESATLKAGIDVDRPYRAELVAENYSKLTSLVSQDLTLTSQKLTINRSKAIYMAIDDIDVEQSSLDLVAMYSADAAKTIGIAQDSEFLYEARNANDTVDAGDLGGSAGTGITLTTSNVDSVFSVANRKLDVQNVSVDGRFAVISPQFFQVLWERISGKDSMLGDKSAEFASMGTYAGFSLYRSNNLTGSIRWTPANQPSDADTITIQGVTFTFETGTLDAAGKVKSETSTAVTIDNLVAFINAGGAGVSAQGYDLSAANQREVQKWVAVDGTTYVDIYVKGASYITASGSEVADTFTLGKQHNLFGRKGCIDVVVQKEVGAETSRLLSNGKFGLAIGLRTNFGVKAFDTGAKEMVDCELATASF